MQKLVNGALVTIFALTVLFVPTAPAAELVHAWRFEGDTTDASGSGNDGTAVGGSVSYVPGRFGQAIAIEEGVSVLAEDATNLPLEPTDAWSMNIWMNLDAFPANLAYLAGWGGRTAARGGGQGSRRAFIQFTSGFYFWGFNWDLDSGSPYTADGTWHMYTITYDGVNVSMYLDAELLLSNPATTDGNPVGSVAQPNKAAPVVQLAGPSYWAAPVAGKFDEYTIWAGALTEAEVEGMLNKTVAFIGKATSPRPASGSILDARVALLEWRNGARAESQNLYIGDSFEAVCQATPDSPEFKGNQPENNYILLDLTPGQTYYWRVDAIKEGDPNSPWTGDVWDFTVRPVTAFRPAPANTMPWVNPAEVLLQWEPGMDALIHEVYLGTDKQAVLDRASSTALGKVFNATERSVEGLQADTTYYWAVDEVQLDLSRTTGSIWSFSTVGDVPGIQGHYFSNKTLFDEPVLTRMDPAINFDWGQSSPDIDVIPPGEFSVRWVGELQVPWTDTYRIVARASDGVRLWIDGRQLINDWVDRVVAKSSTELTLSADTPHHFVLEYYQGFHTAVIELMWESTHFSEQPIPAGALQPMSAAGLFRPLNGEEDVALEPTLQWWSMPQVKQHDVYLGTDPNAVAEATPATTGIYQKRLDAGQTSFSPSRLDWNTTYYWRVDEIGPTSTTTGRVWSFTTANGVVIDGFESYSALDGEQVYLTWLDGYGGDTSLGGSTTGHLKEPFVEIGKVYRGAQSLPFYYVNDGSFVDFNGREGTAAFSLLLREFDNPQNFQRRDNRSLEQLVVALTGSRTNGEEDVYVTLTDAAGKAGTVNHPANPLAVQSEAWSEWSIALSAFRDQGVDVSRIQSITLGIGNMSQKAGNKGVLWVDSLRLVPASTP